MNKKLAGIYTMIFVLLCATVIFVVSCGQKGTAESDGIDTYLILDHMSEFVRYIDRPVTSKEDIEQIDLIYFLFDLSLRENNTEYELIEYYDTSDPGNMLRAEQHTVSADTLAEYMENYFGIGIAEQYFDKYKNGYKYKSSQDFYDAATDTYKFITVNMYLWSSDYSISKTDTKIYIDKNDITVKTMYLYDYYLNSSTDDVRTSADYKFTAHQKDGKTYYKLESVDIYEDDRNKNRDVVLSVDGYDFTAPWVTVERNGKSEYYPPFQSQSAGIYSWSYYPNQTAIWLSGVKDNTAYFMFSHNDAFDVYIYNISKKTGKFISGANANNFSSYHEYTEEDIEFSENESDRAYFNYFIVSMMPESNFALLRCSKFKSESIAGEYYMLDFKTGKETYICDSYTREVIISYMDEYYEWIDKNHLKISVYLEDSNPYYDAIYDGKSWTVTLLQEN